MFLKPIDSTVIGCARKNSLFRAQPRPRLLVELVVREAVRRHAVALLAALSPAAGSGGPAQHTERGLFYIFDVRNQC